MTIANIGVDYPEALRKVARETDGSGTAKIAVAALYHAAQVAEHLIHAVQSQRVEIEDNEVVVTVRWAMASPGTTPSNVAAVNVAAGKGIDVGDPMILLIAHDAIVGCAREAGQGGDACDSDETKH